MDNPISSVKSALSISFLLKFLVGWLVIAALLEVAGATSLLINPVAFIKGKLGKSSS